MGPTERSLVSVLDLMQRGGYDPKGGRPIPIEEIYSANTITHDQYLTIMAENEQEKREYARGMAASEIGAESDMLAGRMLRAGVPEAYVRCTVDKTQNHILNQGRWVCVQGGDVNVVTSKACGLMKGWLSDNQFGTCLFERSTSLLSEFRANEIDAMSRLASVGLLLISGLGAENVSDWTTSKLWELLDRRAGNNRPIVLTTRYVPDELSSHYGSPDVMSLLMDRSILIQA